MLKVYLNFLISITVLRPNDQLTLKLYNQGYFSNFMLITQNYSKFTSSINCIFPVFFNLYESFYRNAIERMRVALNWRENLASLFVSMRARLSIANFTGKKVILSLFQNSRIKSKWKKNEKYYNLIKIEKRRKLFSKDKFLVWGKKIKL